MFIRYLLPLILLTHCQHSIAPKEEQIPRGIRSLLTQTPEKKEGSFNIRLQEKSKLLFQGNLDFATSQKNFTLEVSDSMSQTVFGFQLDLARNIKIYGFLKKHIPLSLDAQSEHLVFAGQSIPFHIEDVQFLLSGQIPRDWLSDLVSVNQNSVRFEQKHRTILVTEDSSQGTCVDFSWSRYLGLIRYHALWCFDQNKKHKISIQDKVLDLTEEDSS